MQPPPDTKPPKLNRAGFLSIGGETNAFVNDRIEQCDPLYLHPIKLSELMSLPMDIKPVLAPVETQFSVEIGTTLQACARLRQELGPETNIAALNFASAKNPGGGFLRGSNAQEESLARSSGLYPCLTKFMKEHYDANRSNKSDARALYSNRGIYSPNVQVLRDDAGAWRSEPFAMSFISVAAPNAGAFFNTNDPANAENVKAVDDALTERISLVLAMAASKGVEVLILGAFGCGVFRNDPTRVAQIFHDLLHVGAYSKRFKQVVFSIYAGNKREARMNVDPFMRLFQDR